MTYCTAVLLETGMIFASDSRTNAGVDHISTFRKMHRFGESGDRLIVILSAGNLSITQSTINLLERAAAGEGQEEAPATVTSATSMSQVAELVGEALREVKRRDGPALERSRISSSGSFLVGGQIRGERQRLFQVYDQGNFIEATAETPYFQIGESKYGRPILDRIVRSSTDLVEAAKCVLVSFDSTMRSNISVGPPIDLLVYEKDRLEVTHHRRIDEGDAYLELIRREWEDALRRAFAELPDPDWFAGG